MAALFCGFSAGTARADGLFIPFIGWNFGGDAGDEFGDAIDSSRLSWGASLGWMGAGVIGVEGDFAYSPDFFGKTDLGDSSVLTAFGNVLVGVPFGGQKGFGIRPYGLAGIGLVRAQGEAFDINGQDLDENKVGWNFGGGVMLFFGTHAGVRATFVTSEPSKRWTYSASSSKTAQAISTSRAVPWASCSDSDAHRS
jgi:hypothetical protein